MPLLALSERNARFLFCGGKGGVGKTTIAVAIGLYLAKHGKRTLVFSTDPAHSLSDSLEIEIGDKLTQVDEESNLWCIEISSKRVLKELRERYRRVTEEALRQFLGRGMDMPLDRKIIEDMMDITPPGLDELMTLSKLTDIIDEQIFDYIVIDTAAGAHALRLIELPDIIDEWVDAGLNIHYKYRNIMKLDESRQILLEHREDIRRLRESLLNPEKAAFIAVTIPEDMGISITGLMIDGFKSLGLSCDDIIVNFVIPPDVECSYCNSRRREQMDRIKDIYDKFPEKNVIIMPLFPQPVSGIKLLTDFVEIVFEGKHKQKPSTMKSETPERPLTEVMEAARLDLENKKLILFGGKGGVGKTTTSASTGIYMAEQGMRTLVLSIDPQHSLADSFDQDIAVSESLHRDTEEEITAIKSVNNLYAMEIDAKKLFEEWRDENRDVFIQITSDATILDSKDAASFIDLSLPGMDEIMALKKLQHLLKEGEFDLYILDTAPTGHTLRFLEIPELMRDWINLLKQMRAKTRYIQRFFFGGRAKRIRNKADRFLKEEMVKIKRIQATLRGYSTEFIPVTILEEMAIDESERLLDGIRRNRIRVTQIICNQLIPWNPECVYCRSIREKQQEELTRVGEIFAHLQIVYMPSFPHEIRGVEALSTFGKILFEGEGEN